MKEKADPLQRTTDLTATQSEAEAQDAGQAGNYHFTHTRRQSSRPVSGFVCV